MRISDWSSDVCSSDLRIAAAHHPGKQRHALVARGRAGHRRKHERPEIPGAEHLRLDFPAAIGGIGAQPFQFAVLVLEPAEPQVFQTVPLRGRPRSSEEQPSELQSLMTNSYARFCL